MSSIDQVIQSLTPPFLTTNTGICKHYDLRMHLVNLAIFLDENTHGSNKAQVMSMLESFSTSAQNILRTETNI